ncbi:hypothetical protein C8R47DRAFT_1159061 [Mycena vitilis]|nr:hypothetical protein C8R47DRAFT_1159061 [Mycena vitilis]
MPQISSMTGRSLVLLWTPLLRYSGNGKGTVLLLQISIQVLENENTYVRSLRALRFAAQIKILRYVLCGSVIQRAVHETIAGIGTDKSDTDRHEWLK